MKKSIFLLCFIIGLSACSKHENLFDSSRVEEEAKKNFPVQNVDPNHSWTMMEVRTAKVVLQNANENYTVKLYNTNPVVDSNATLLSKVAANGKNEVVFSFDAPKALTNIFVSVEGVNKRVVKKADLKEGVFAISFVGSDLFAKSSQPRVVGNDPFPLDQIVGTPTPSELASLFPTKYPAQIEETLESGAPNLNVLVKSGRYTKVNFWVDSQNVSMYIAPDANVTFAGSFYMRGYQLYIMKGANVTFENILIPSDGRNMISIAEGATLTIANVGQSFQGKGESNTMRVYNRGIINLKENGLNVGGYGYLYNAGEIKAKIVESNGGAISRVYNDNTGTIETTEKIFIGGGGDGGYWINKGKIITPSLKVDTKAIQNDGKLTVADNLTLDNKANFYNTNSVEVTGKTSITQGPGVYWINEGHYTTGTMYLSANNSTSFNKCQLIVKQNFDINTATFNVDGYVVANSMKMTNALVEMISGSTFNVLGKTSLISQGSGIRQGFSCLRGDDYALVKLNQVVKDQNHRDIIGFYGNIKYAINDIFSEVSMDSGTYPNIYYDNNASGVDYEAVIIKTPSLDTCNPGWEDDEVDIPSDKVAEYTYAFEDMTTEAGDFDYNDVVLRVSAPKDGKITVTLVAAGASRNLKIGYNLGSGVSGSLFGGNEVHNILGQTEGSLINTGAGSTATPKSEDITVPTNFSLTANGDIFIIDDKGIEVHVREFQQTAVPYGLRIPSGWKYPSERSSIVKAYPPFEEWAKDQNKNMNWYLEENAKTEFIYNK